MGAQAVERSWTDDALCRWEDPELWYPSGSGETLRRNSLEARLICYRCPVQQQCLEDALSQSPYRDYGVWGGTTHEERDLLRRKRSGRRMCGQYIKRDLGED